MRVIEFSTNFYWPLLPEVIISTYRRRRRGGWLRSLLGVDTAVFFVSLYGPWDGRSVKKLLSRAGIDMWGYSTYDDLFLFHVHRNDAWLTRRILEYFGVDLRTGF